MATFFTTRQYPHDVVQKALERSHCITREDALVPSTTQSKNEDRVVAVIPFHPHNIHICHILKKNFHIIQRDVVLNNIFPKPPLIAFKRSENIKDLLVRSKVAGNQNSDNTHTGCKPCMDKKCKTCPFIHTATCITGPSGSFDIKAHFTCKSTDIVYILSCSMCSKLYVGETYRSLDEHLTEHLRSMKLNYNNPNGQHFNLPHHSFMHAKLTAEWQSKRDRHCYRIELTMSFDLTYFF